MNMEKALYSVEEVLERNGGILPISKSMAYQLIKKNKIPATHIGKRVFICGEFIRELVEKPKKI